MPGPLGIGGGGGGSGGTVTTPVFPFIDRAVAQTSDTGSITYATPGSSAIGDTAAAGTATTVSRSDHVHGREAAGTPGASAVGDTASAGSATTVARSDHRHSREAFGTPVNIDASLTSLSTGSLTTVARADHVHTVSKVPVLIASTTLASDQASYTFTSIPQTYTHLELGIYATSNFVFPYDYMACQFNGDTGSNYYWNPYNNATASTNGNLANITGTTNLETNPTYNRSFIAGYTSSNTKSAYNAFGFLNVSATIHDHEWYSGFTYWTGTAAISSIKVFPGNGTLIKAGAILSLYGIP